MRRDEERRGVKRRGEERRGEELEYVVMSCATSKALLTTTHPDDVEAGAVFHSPSLWPGRPLKLHARALRGS